MGTGGYNVSSSPRFFLPCIDKSFANGDKVMKVEHAGVESKILVVEVGKKD